MHTYLSDGALSPDELIALVKKQRLKAWSITDHDTCAVYDRIGDEEGLVCGVEITSEFEGHEIHVVALGVDRHSESLIALLNNIKEIRLSRAEALLEEIHKTQQVKLSVDDVKPAEAIVVTRFHIAQGLRAKGVIQNHRQFFNELFPDERMRQLSLAAYPSIEEVASVINSAGGVSILAHPSRYAGFDLVERIMALGLDGLELKYPHNESEEQLAQLAEKHDYLLSCGSDLHWAGRRQPGEWRLSRSQAAPLLERIGWKDPLD